MFWVTQPIIFPVAHRSATARWAALGAASRAPEFMRIFQERRRVSG